MSRIGHRAVIDTLKNAASGKGLSPARDRLRPPPARSDRPQRAPKRLVSPCEEECRLRSLGVEVEMIPFTRGLMSLTAREWMQRMHCTMDVDILVAGYDNTFGCDGIGDVDSRLQSHRPGNRNRSRMAAPFVPGASSSEVRRALLAGETGKAAGMLGENYRLGGEVVKGGSSAALSDSPRPTSTPHGQARPGKASTPPMPYCPAAKLFPPWSTSACAPP